MKTRQRHELSVQRPDAGFGLVSVMVAIVLLLVGVLSLSQLLTQSVSMQTISLPIPTPVVWMSRSRVMPMKRALR